MSGEKGQQLIRELAERINIVLCKDPKSWYLFEKDPVMVGRLSRSARGGRIRWLSQRLLSLDTQIRDSICQQLLGVDI